MDKNQITQVLEEKHADLIHWIRHNGEEKWMVGPKERWTTGQHILHLVITARMINKALRYPKFLIRYKFGTSNRPSRSYEQVAKRYKERLDENRDKAREFNRNLKVPDKKELLRMVDELQILNKKLQYKTRKFKDKHLDTLLLPHPLMGRMTLREIIMWSAYHVEHHYLILKEEY